MSETLQPQPIAAAPAALPLRRPARSIIRVNRIHPTSADVAWGCGRAMDAGEIERGLARIAAKGIRTSSVREIAGIPVVMTKDVPQGLIAMRTARGFEAIRGVTGETVAVVPVA